MKVSLFCTNRYLGREAMVYPGWPVPPALYHPEAGLRSFNHSLELVRLAEDLGFDWISCSEHHYTPMRQTPNAAVFAAALSQVVRHARIAVLGPLVSMNNPVRVAEELAMLDQLSGGRLVVLFLRGTPNEFLTYGTNPDETRDRTQEACTLIQRALTEPQPFGWEGRFFRFRTVAVWPGPIQRPHPPMYYSGNSFESAAFAAKRHLGLAISFYPPHLVAQLAEYYRHECAKSGWEPGPDQLLYRGFIGVGEDEAEAGALQSRYFGEASVMQFFRGRAAAVAPPRAPAPPTSDADGKSEGGKSSAGIVLGSLHFCGDSKAVVKQIVQLHEQAGVGIIDLAFSGPGLTENEALKSLRLFGTEVLPRIRRLGAQRSNNISARVAT
jgi:alkanesulfonate monooxygenase SsuD/methylene tetrahydromethanopterin reductase-like flavin-dependent oxidoreductase (luciferase family)